MESQLEIIDAFIDGERVDAAALKRALDNEAGRDYFVDAWMLREAVQQDRDTPTVHRVAAAPRRRTVGGWAVAAALVAGVAGGYLAAYRTTPPADSVNAPAPVATSIATGPSPAAFPAPEPTRVIQLEFRAEPTKGGGD